MPSKKYTAQKREEIDKRKRSRPVTKKNIFKKNKFMLPFLSMVVILLLFVSFIIVFNPFAKEDATNPIAIIDTTMGTIKIELFEDKVPITAGNFIYLANEGFYDGLVFHRVIGGFMIQSGGFESDGTQHNSDQITFETHPDVRHVDGAISMASTAAKTGGTNQFFICDGAQHGLDSDYAPFGVVVEGIDVVRDIANVETTTKYEYHQNWPIDDIIINSISIIDQ